MLQKPNFLPIYPKSIYFFSRITEKSPKNSLFLQKVAKMQENFRLSVEQKFPESRESLRRKMHLKAQIREEGGEGQELEVRRSREGNADLTTAESVKKSESRESLKAHLQRYTALLKSHQSRRTRLLASRRLTDNVNSALHSRSHQALISLEKQQKEEQIRTISAKANAVARKKRYGELVKELFFPKVDRKKTEEMQILKNKFSRKNKCAKSAENRRKNDDLMDSYKKHVWIMPRLRQAPKIPPQPIENKPKIPDYLAEQKKIIAKQVEKVLKKSGNVGKDVSWEEDLKDESLNEEEKVSRVKRKVAKLEDQVRREEALLSHLDTASVQSLQAESSLNDLLISSVKAKLALLQS